jgi:O-antigen/teichoic acid export membrane protein
MNRLAPARALRGTLWRFAYLAAQAGFSLITFVGLALILPTREFAPASVALGVLVIAGALADLGLSSASISVLPSRIARQPEARAEILSGAVKAFYLAASLALFIPLITLPGLDRTVRFCVLAIAPAAPAYVLVSGADTILRATGEFRRPVLLVTLNRLGGALALPIAAITSSGVWSCAAAAIGTLLATFPSYRLLAHVRALAPGAASRPTVHAALPLGISQIFIVLGGRANTVIVSSVVSATAAAAFETAWRLFQIGQYFAGAVATGIAPFLGDALGRDRRADLDRLLFRALAIVAGGGLLFCVLIILIRQSVSDLLVGDLGKETAAALLPLAIVSPLAFAGFVGTVVLSMSGADRRVILFANGFGAALNLGLAFPLTSSHGAPGAAVASACGLAASQAIILSRVVVFRRRLRYSSAISEPHPSVSTFP